ncbi:hypothetical protein LFL96_22335 [Paraburkholderia sp. D15]|uniref:hypothetical protein n=1 Tax=Paraburkholderia sp. D15 TaxID=2880218 RepID=UPI00247B2023|nr:hypothetical protein [Paraburkholderia sp. D15]WGS53787.1 hypothetical protein LFL96_22335 [Paraburkholderia sp. D15]WKF60685.1 hypothetical protein HUO10_005206 [Paraburkholderia busanensis]
MPRPALRHLASVGLIAIAALLGACGDSVSSSPSPVAKSACGNAAIATTHMSCPPGVTSPAS